MGYELISQRKLGSVGGALMANNSGMKVTIRKEDFTQQDPADRDWLLYEGILNINSHGCEFGRRTHKFARIEKWKMIGVGFAAAIPIIYILAKLFIPGCP